MRKIESDMLTIIKHQRDAVALREDGKVITSVYLYCNMIAQGDAFVWGFKMCGWPTTTTKSRINALAVAFRRDGVYTKAGKHYSGEKEINSYDWF